MWGLCCEILYINRKVHPQAWSGTDYILEQLQVKAQGIKVENMFWRILSLEQMFVKMVERKECPAIIKKKNWMAGGGGSCHTWFFINCFNLKQKEETWRRPIKYDFLLIVPASLCGQMCQARYLWIPNSYSLWVSMTMSYAFDGLPQCDIKGRGGMFWTTLLIVESHIISKNGLVI